MYKDNKEDVSASKLEYIMISLISYKTNVLIVGGGRAALIKARTFSKDGCSITILSKEFIPEFKGLLDEGNLVLIKDSYNKKYILDKHIVIIAVDDEESIKNIVRDCEENYKLFLDCSNFKRGQFITPFQRQTDNIKFAIQTRRGSPKTSRFLGEKVKKLLDEYDGFVQYTCTLREKVKTLSNKEDIMEFVCSDDFYLFFQKGIHELVLEMFYGGSNDGTKNCIT